MRTEVILITPNMAAEMLNKNHANRKIDDRAVQKYASDMRNGLWELTHQGIAFNDNGFLIDGQHRLMAVIRSERPVLFNVTWDIHHTAYHIDRCKKRTLYDNLNMGFVSINPELINKRLIEGVNGIFRMGEGIAPRLPDSDVISFINQYESPLLDVCPILRKKRVKIFSGWAFTTAYIAAHINGVPVDTLDRFDDIVRNGFYNKDEERAAVALRNYLINISNIRLGKDALFRIEYAIKQFNSKIVMSRSYLPDKLMYPVYFERQTDTKEVQK